MGHMGIPQAMDAHVARKSQAEFLVGLSWDPRVWQKEAWINPTHKSSHRLTWPDIGLVWPQRLNINFTYHKYSLLDICRRCNPYKFHIRCNGIATSFQWTGSLTYLFKMTSYRCLVSIYGHWAQIWLILVLLRYICWR